MTVSWRKNRDCTAVWEVVFTAFRNDSVATVTRQGCSDHGLSNVVPMTSVGLLPSLIVVVVLIDCAVFDLLSFRCCCCCGDTDG